MKQKWGIKEGYQKLYAALCKFYCYLVLNEHEVILDLYCISFLRCQPLHTMTKAPLENTVSWSLWILHTQLPPYLHPQHWTLQMWYNSSMYLVELFQLVVLSKACPSWVYNLVLDQVLVYSVFCFWHYTNSKSCYSRYTMLNDSRDSGDRGMYQDEFLLSSYLLLELYIKWYKLRRLNEIKWERKLLLLLVVSQFLSYSKSSNS